MNIKKIQAKTRKSKEISILKNLVKFILRCMFLPFSFLVLALTALIEIMSNEDWKFWKDQNSFFLKVLPWAKY